MDLPLEAKDWWTFLLPGGFLALQLILLYDLLGVAVVTYKLPFETFNLPQFVGSLNSGQIALFTTGFLVFSVLVGFALELLTYQIFRNETRKGLPKWIAEIWKEEQLSPTTAQKLIEQCDKLLGLPKTSQEPRLELTPTMLWALVYNLWSKGTENLVDDLDKTITAWSFCRSMSVASIFGLVLVGWAFLRGLPLIGIGSLLGVFLLVLFFDNQRKTVRKAYFRKVIMYSLTL